MAPLTPPSRHRLAAKAAYGVRYTHSGTDRSWFKVKNILKKEQPGFRLLLRDCAVIGLRKEMSRRCDAAGGLLEPRVQDARSWKLDKFIIIEVRQAGFLRVA